MSERQAVVKAAHEHSEFTVSSPHYTAQSLRGEKTVELRSGDHVVATINHPEDFVADDVEYEMVNEPAKGETMHIVDDTPEL